MNSIDDSLASYEKSVLDKICTRPVPPYVEDSVSSAASNECDASKTNNDQSESKHDRIYDTCYHLIKLYCEGNHAIESIIAPLTHTSNQLDYRLSWHLAMSLLAVQYKNVSSSCMESLHDNYASQLHALGLWQWSVFVLMHTADARRRESSVRLYLSKNVVASSELTDAERFVVERLRVPSEWVYECKALRAKYERQHDSQFKLLLKAHKWNEAHCVLVDLLAPDLFMRQNFNTLLGYLSTLAVEHNAIHKWSTGGGIYYDFLRMHQQFELAFQFAEQDATPKVFEFFVLFYIHFGQIMYIYMYMLQQQKYNTSVRK